MREFTEIPSLVGVGVHAVKDEAQRLGLGWEMVNATITQMSPLLAKVDGDEVSVGAHSMIGSLFLGARVYAIRMPSGGLYVSGWAGHAPGDLVGWKPGTADTASVGAAETVVDTITRVQIQAGRVYRLGINGRVDTSVAGAFVFRFRKTDISGQILMLAQVQRPGAAQTWEAIHNYISSRDNLTVDLALTLLVTAGTVLIRSGYFLEVHAMAGGFFDYTNVTQIS